MAIMIAIPVATMVIVLSIGCVCSGGVGVSGAGPTETRVSAQELPYESSPAKVAVTL